jgi:hypothetical protein
VLVVWSHCPCGGERGVVLLVLSDCLLGREVVPVVWSHCPCRRERGGSPGPCEQIRDLCREENRNFLNKT